MILRQALFKARLFSYPETKDKETEETKKIGRFTVGKKYKVHAIYDSGEGFTEFLVADDEGAFRWIGMRVFRAR